jgi:hypothetical protein
MPKSDGSWVVGKKPRHESLSYFLFLTSYFPRRGRLEGARVMRGGSFVGSAYRVRCALRHGLSPDLRYVDIGFRVVASPVNSEL